MTRREMLALLTLAACGARTEPPPAMPPKPLAFGRAVDVVPAAGLVWLVDANLRELFASAVLEPAVRPILPAARLDAFAKQHGGIDLRSVSELALAGYAEATLAVARSFVDPTRVEQAFVRRARSVDGRAMEGSIVRTWGTVGGAREQLAIFGREGAALEWGRFGPLRAAQYFAEGKLKRARPALLTDPLAQASALVGDAPLRAFAPGPFTGDVARGLGGLLAGATAVGVSATPVPRREHELAGVLWLRFVMTGAWGVDALAAAERLRASFELLSNDPIGRLLGIDRPYDGPHATGDAQVLRLEVALDVQTLGKGLYDATGATIEEAMRI